MQWEVAIAFPRGQENLRDAVDRALAGLATKTAELMAKYGFPKAKPTRLALSSTRYTGDDPDPVQKTAAVPVPAKPAGNAKEISAGRETFNLNCEHCHGPDAITGLEERNLRHLVRDSSGKMDQTFWDCVIPGRVEKGMPSWKGILTHAQLAQILVWLHTVQER
jgi:mono/diheme cytochrome c family protein